MSNSLLPPTPGLFLLIPNSEHNIYLIKIEIGAEILFLSLSFPSDLISI